jgi:hypothetical protein
MADLPDDVLPTRAMLVASGWCTCQLCRTNFDIRGCSNAPLTLSPIDMAGAVGGGRCAACINHACAGAGDIKGFASGGAPTGTGRHRACPGPGPGHGQFGGAKSPTDRVPVGSAAGEGAGAGASGLSTAGEVVQVVCGAWFGVSCKSPGLPVYYAAFLPPTRTSRHRHGRATVTATILSPSGTPGVACCRPPAASGLSLLASGESGDPRNTPAA